MHEADPYLVLCAVIRLLLVESFNRLDESRIYLIKFVFVLSLWQELLQIDAVLLLNLRVDKLNGLDQLEYAFKNQVQLCDLLPFDHGRLPATEGLLLEVVGVLHEGCSRDVSQEWNLLDVIDPLINHELMLLQNDLKVGAIEHGKMAISHACEGGVPLSVADECQLAKDVTLPEVQHLLKCEQTIRKIAIGNVDDLLPIVKRIAALDMAASLGVIVHVSIRLLRNVHSHSCFNPGDDRVLFLTLHLRAQVVIALASGS